MRSRFIFLTVVLSVAACRDDRPTAIEHPRPFASRIAARETGEWPLDSTLAPMGGSNYLFSLVPKPASCQAVSASVMDVSQAGRIVLWCGRDAAYWQLGMQLPASLPLGKAYGINDEEMIAGFTTVDVPNPGYPSVTRTRGALWSAGNVTVAPAPKIDGVEVPPPCYGSWLSDVNNAGHAVGVYNFFRLASCPSVKSGSHLFLWRGGQEVVGITTAKLYRFPGAYKTAWINDADLIVSQADSGTRWIAWQDGVIATVATNGPEVEGNRGFVNHGVFGAMNRRGDLPLEGLHYDSTTSRWPDFTFAALWSGGVLRRLPHAPYWGAGAFAVTDDGVVGGAVFDSVVASPWIERGAFWRGGRLDEVIPCDPGGMCIQPALFAARDIVGWVCSISSAMDAARRCVFVLGTPVDRAQALQLVARRLRSLNLARGDSERFVQVIENSAAALERGNEAAARGMLSALLNKLATTHASGGDPLGEIRDAVPWLSTVIGNILAQASAP